MTPRPREEIARWLETARKGTPSYWSAEAVAEIGRHLEAAETLAEEFETMLGQALKVSEDRKKQRDAMVAELVDLKNQIAALEGPQKAFT